MTDEQRADLRSLYAREVRERGFHEDRAQLAILEHLENLRQRLIERQSSRTSLRRNVLGRFVRRTPQTPERGLYLWGAVGRGKTWLMDLFYQNLPFAERRRRHFHRFMHDVHAELKTLAGRESPLESVADRIADNVRVLCFDELFVTDIADAMILGTLFDALFRREVTLVATSNLAPRDLYKDGLQRQRFIPAIELLEHHMDVVTLNGPVDYRLRQLTQAGTYLNSSDPATSQRLETLFRDLADGGELDGTIEIEGREIPVVRASDTAVWFDFSVLCGGPRSQNDYIEIARDYQSVIVCNVPVFTSEVQDDAARRLISLVDVLYDHCVNLIVSAAASPQELYRSQRLRQEFQRTASRLTEMQSEEYLAREHQA